MAIDPHLRLGKVVSGGQTGADQGGLRAAKRLGIPTGGWMPRGWRTEDGPRPEFRELYGMLEHESFDYADRTRRNVEDSDATLIVGNVATPGCSLTRQTCRETGKAFLIVARQRDIGCAFCEVYDWLRNGGFAVLNVAGNRESLNRGIGRWTEALLAMALAEGVDKLFKQGREPVNFTEADLLEMLRGRKPQ